MGETGHSQVSSHGICLTDVLLDISIHCGIFQSLESISFVYYSKSNTLNCELSSIPKSLSKPIKNILMTKEIEFCEFSTLMNKGSKNHLKKLTKHRYKMYLPMAFDDMVMAWYESYMDKRK